MYDFKLTLPSLFSLSLFFQIIQEEIASHGKVLKSILRTCQEHENRRRSSQQKEKQKQQQESPEKKKKQQQKKSSSSSSFCAELADLLPEIESLEDRWHQIGLRALEWQYFLEGLAWTEEQQEDDANATDASRRGEVLKRRNIKKQVRSINFVFHGNRQQ